MATTSLTNPLPPPPLVKEEKLEEEEGESQLPLHFKEYEEWYEELSDMLDSGTEVKEEVTTMKVRKLISQLEPYQQQPSLLDPHLKPILERLVTYLQSAIRQFPSTEDDDPSQQQRQQRELLLQHHHRGFLILYQLMKLRGYKTIRMFLSHETSDLEPLFRYLLHHLQHLPDRWETTYGLLIWLSMVCLVPLDLSRIDSGDSNRVGYSSLVDHLMSTCQTLLLSRGKPSEGAAIVLGKLLTRKDLIPTFLPQHLEWAHHKLLVEKDLNSAHPILASLVTILKTGAREDLLPYTETLMVLLRFEGVDPATPPNALVRKDKLKLAQQIGLTQLKPRLAAWRYQRGMRSLGAMSDSSEIEVPKPPSEETHDTGEDEFEVPEAIEDLMAVLLEGIVDKESTCRWSAAKGLGRLTQRLPFSLAEDIITYLIHIFDENVISDHSGVKNYSSVHETTWHGACLTLAELARRGLLPRTELAGILELIVEALHLDIRRGSHSVGSIVRDAACYVFWSFARAYPTTVFESFSLTLAQKLVIASVYDREINVRRASSAAFQEFVGRMQLFPHGIEIMALTDYFAVGNITNSYLRASILVAQFPEYRGALFQHLYTVSFRHWDITVRKLAAQALADICLLEEDASISQSMIHLVAQLTVPDLATKHGALLALGEISHAWSRRLPSESHPSTVIYQTEGCSLTYATVTEALTNLTERELNSFGSEVIREGLCSTITHLSQAHWPLDAPTRAWCKSIIDTTLSRKEPHLQAVASQALGAFSQAYPLSEEDYNSYFEAVKDPSSEIRRRGVALALGHIQIKDAQTLRSIINLLTTSARDTTVDTETRTNFMTGISTLLTRAISGEPLDLSDGLDTIILTFFDGLEDYTTTNRGDVGSHVRKVAIAGLASVVTYGDQGGRGAVTPHLGEIAQRLLQQSVEKIDRVRLGAGTALQALLRQHTTLPDASHLTCLLDPVDWQSPADLFPRVVPILSSPTYRRPLLTGLVTSAGSMTESLMRYAGEALVDYLLEAPEEIQLATAYDLLHLLTAPSSTDRVTLPTLEVLRMTLEADLFHPPTFHDFDVTLATHLRRSLQVCRVHRRLTLGSKILCQLAPYPHPTLRPIVWSTLLRLLTHPTVQLRLTTSESLYLTLTTSPSSPIDNDDPTLDLDLLITDLLLETDWSSPLPQLRALIQPLYHQFDLPIPTYPQPRPRPSQ